MILDPQRGKPVDELGEIGFSWVFQLFGRGGSLSATGGICLGYINLTKLLSWLSQLPLQSQLMMVDLVGIPQSLLKPMAGSSLPSFASHSTMHFSDTIQVFEHKTAVIPTMCGQKS